VAEGGEGAVIEILAVGTMQEGAGLTTTSCLVGEIHQATGEMMLQGEMMAPGEISIAEEEETNREMGASETTVMKMRDLS